MDKKILFVINLKSGSSGKRRKLEEIKNHVLGEGYEVSLCDSPESFEKAKAQIKSRNFEIIVAVGGDGTVNFVASHLVHSEVILGIIPMGSGNGLAGHLNIPMDWKQAFRLILEGKSRRMDAGKVNERFFFCTVGFGFEAKLAYEFSKSKKRGLISYAQMAARHFFAYKGQQISIEFGEEKLTVNPFLLTIANAGQYGNNFWISPKARVDSGQLELCILKKPSMWNALPILMKFRTKTLKNSNVYKTYSGRNFYICSSTSLLGHVDGDGIASETKFEIDVVEKSLNVIVKL